MAGAGSEGEGVVATGGERVCPPLSHPSLKVQCGLASHAPTYTWEISSATRQQCLHTAECSRQCPETAIPRCMVNVVTRSFF